MPNDGNPASTHRRGVAMMLVLVMSVVILSMGLAMMSLSGEVLGNAVDAKTKIRARYAAESSISVAIADAVYQAGEIFGGGVSSSTREVVLGGDKGTADVSSGNNLGQEVILQKRSPMNNLRGNKIPLKIDAVGRAGSAKSRISASVALYQVPIYQFGVFYEGPLEITPGGLMNVWGRVHTNSNAYFRTYGSGANGVFYQGPVTVAGDILQWKYAAGNELRYRLKPDSTTNLYSPGLTTNLTVMTASTQPQPIGGVRNVRFNETKLILPIGVGTPHSILGPRDEAGDPAALKRQKFDWIVKTRSSAEARFVFTGSESQPTWIKGPFVFFDRRELAWIKVWDFNVGVLAGTSNKDSIFYLDDLTTKSESYSGTSKLVINAFRIVNAANLPRNMTIASGKPVYVQGNFNIADASGNYKNAQIASDAVTVLSAQWADWDLAHYKAGTIPAANSSMEQPFSNPSWVSWAGSTAAQKTALINAQSTAQTGTAVNADVRMNTAMITGNKQSSSVCLAAGTSDGTFNNCYEGGWHNSLRFLERWSGRTVMFRGSFVCMWEAQTPGLRSSPTPGVPVMSTAYYERPNRDWGYDTRFNDLNNMPPGAPFLATAILTNWLERN